MKATEAKFLEFIKKSPQFVIPIYQRTYSWTEKECRQLWEDILRTGSNDDISAHFVGSIVYIEKGLYHVIEPIAAAGDRRPTTPDDVDVAVDRDGEGVGETRRRKSRASRWLLPRKLRNYYLVNPEEEGERHHKLILSQTDKDTVSCDIT